jgi:hypothetical protein
VAVNFALASGLLLTGAALAATVLGLGGSLLLTLRARRAFAAEGAPPDRAALERAVA